MVCSNINMHVTYIQINLPSRNSSVTNSAAVLNLQEAAAWAKQSPQLRTLAPIALKLPPYRSNFDVKSISSSPERANALPV